eukprot:scaffold1123_cov347-Prasinococcus_capsulatus_cf.AAC.4
MALQKYRWNSPKRGRCSSLRSAATVARVGRKNATAFRCSISSWRATPASRHGQRTASLAAAAAAARTQPCGGTDHLVGILEALHEKYLLLQNLALAEAQAHDLHRVLVYYQHLPASRARTSPERGYRKRPRQASLLARAHAADTCKPSAHLHAAGLVQHARDVVADGLHQAERSSRRGARGGHESRTQATGEPATYCTAQSKRRELLRLKLRACALMPPLLPRSSAPSASAAAPHHSHAPARCALARAPDAAAATATHKRR